MSMDGRFIHFLTKELDEQLQAGRIQKIYQLAKADFLFSIRTRGKSHSLYLSLSTSMARMHVTKYTYDKPDAPSGFCMLLRKYLEGGLILQISQLVDDRVIDLHIQNINEIGETTELHLIMEIMGRYANLIVTDRAHTIIDAYKHISPFEEKERSIERGLPYPTPKDEKCRPNDLECIKTRLTRDEELTKTDLIANIRGISPLLARAILSAMKSSNQSKIETYSRFLNPQIDPVIAVTNEKIQFYYMDVFPGSLLTHFQSLSDLLDAYYLEAGRLNRMKQLSKYIYQLVKREFEKNTHKLEKLTKDLQVASQYETFRIHGDLILAYLYEIQKGASHFKGISHEIGSLLEVTLDPLKTPIQNAHQYYRKYKKSKTAIAHIEQQIALTKNLILYFDLLTSQIEQASQADMDEIRDELASQGFMKQKGRKIKKKKPNIDIYLDASGTEICVGKNNLQNEYMTHELASKEDFWFHTKDLHGSHVIVRTPNPSEDTIRTAAMLAAFFSKGRHSSSVPVDYTKIRYVKKIPGQAGSFVTYTNQKTIYIDPSQAAVDQLKKLA